MLTISLKPNKEGVFTDRNAFHIICPDGEVLVFGLKDKKNANNRISMDVPRHYEIIRGLPKGEEDES